VGARQEALAGGTFAAGLQGRGAHHGLGEQSGHRALSRAMGTDEQQGMNNAPGLNRTHQLFHFVAVTRKFRELQSRPQIFVNCSTSSTNMVAPPTVTSTGKGTYMPVVPEIGVGVDAICLRLLHTLSIT